MGDMADYAIDQIDWGGNWRGSAVKRCDYCGRRDLTWVKTDKGWRLGLNGVVHKCQEYQSTKNKDSK